MEDFPEIPGYKIIEKLGQGGMSDVYLGEQENLGRKVAIKVLAHTLIREETFPMRFLKEARTAAQLGHPDIITIHDVGQHQDRYYIVMEYLKESLKDRLRKRGKLPVPETLEIVKKLAEALDYAHQKGVVHRDIKPENCMFRLDGTPVLLDFGIAMAVDSKTRLTRTGTRLGTPHYMSPEQCRGEKVDGRSDIYSLGVVLFELLTGSLPFDAENPTGIIFKHIQEPVPKLARQLRKYQPLIKKMMAKNKKDRPQRGADIVKIVDTIVSGRKLPRPDLIPAPVKTESEQHEQTEVLTTPIPELELTPIPRKKNRRLIVYLFAITIIFTGLYIFVLNKKTSTEPVSITKTETRKSIADEKVSPPVKKPSPQEQKKNQDFQVNLKMAEEYFSSKEYDKALEKIKAAKKIKVNPEITTLEKNIQQEKERVLKTSDKRTEEEKKPKVAEKAKPKEEVKKEIPVKVLKTLKLLNLLSGIQQQYIDKMKRVEIPIPEEGIVATGQVNLILNVSEKGAIAVKELDDRWLNVTPEGKKSPINKKILQKIQSITLTPPRDEKGEAVKVEGWRLYLKVATFQEKIILYK